MRQIEGANIQIMRWPKSFNEVLASESTEEVRLAYATLTDDQKSQLAEVDSTCKARIAEKELFLQGKIRDARQAGKFDEAETLESQLATETRRLREDCEEKKAKLRESFAK